MGQLISDIDFGARPITSNVDGSPYQPGQNVIVVDSIEGDDPLIGVTEFIGKSGIITYLEYSCGCGQKFPNDPMIGVQFPDSTVQEFWAEELRLEH